MDQFKSSVLENQPNDIEVNSNNKELLLETFREHVISIITSTEKILYNMYTAKNKDKPEEEFKDIDYIEEVVDSSDSENEPEPENVDIEILNNLKTNENDQQNDIISTILIDYFKGLNNGIKSNLDDIFINNINNIISLDNNIIILLLEHIIQMIYDEFSVNREELKIDDVVTYISSVKDHINIIFHIKKVEILKMINSPHLLH